ncbi:MAG: alpha-mannosidase [Promethearchaeota archaeon]
MSEIFWLDGKILKPFFRFCRKTHLIDGIIYLILKGVEYYGNGPLPKGRYGLGRIKWTSFKKLVLTGQSHLDAAWRWRTKQGILKARATFKKALEHIEDSSLPYFTFSQPSPCYYYWMKRFFPQIYKRIKRAIKAGRLVPIGGCWVETDCNIPSGESLIRQRLYGQRFYLKEFGIISDIEFIQDSFGFNYNLPQIFKKSGAKLFGTGKLFWNETEKIPIGMAIWEGPDGTQLPMIHVHFGYFLPINYGKLYPNIYRLGKKGKKLVANYSTPLNKYKNWWSKELMLESIFGYGLGDGGHGPIELEILVVECLRQLRPKRIFHNRIGSIYEMYSKYFDRWAIWKDEWYLDVHRGTYTSVSRIKRGNRLCENRLEEIEKFSSILSLINAFPSNKKDLVNIFKLYGLDIEKNGQNLVADINKQNIHIRGILEFLWKTTLYNQFHDILPGSSIPEVYKDYDKYLAQIMSFFQVLNKISILSSLTINLEMQKIIKQNLNYTPIIIFNPLSWNRKGIVEIELGNKNKGILRTIEHQPISTYIVKDFWNDNKFVALAYVEDIPSVGIKYLVFDENSDSPNKIKEEESDVKVIINDNLINSNNINTSNEDNIFNEKIILENNYLRVSIEKSTGLISEIYSKTENYQILNNPANKLLIFEEKKHTDAWNIDPDYEENEIQYDINDFNLKIIENTPIRSTVEIKRKISKSIFIQRISLKKNSDMLFLSLDVDMKDSQWLVKLDFPINLKTNKLVSEIPYAVIERNIKPLTKLDAARWEQCCQKFITIYDETQDISLLIANKGKYGVNAKLDKKKYVSIRPTIVRTPKHTGYAKETIFVERAPDGGLNPNMPQYCDLEFHKNICFGLIVHRGKWSEKNSWKSAYELNFPLKYKFEERITNDEIKFIFKENSCNIKNDLLELNFNNTSTDSHSFVSITPENIQIGAIKFYEDERDPFNPSSLILRLIERSGFDTNNVNIMLNFSPNLKIKEVKEINLLEFHDKITEQANISFNNKSINKINLSLSAFEIKTIQIRFQK